MNHGESDATAATNTSAAVWQVVRLCDAYCHSKVNVNITFFLITVLNTDNGSTFRVYRDQWLQFPHYYYDITLLPCIAAIFFFIIRSMLNLDAQIDNRTALQKKVTTYLLLFDFHHMYAAFRFYLCMKIVSELFGLHISLNLHQFNDIRMNILL